MKKAELRICASCEWIFKNFSSCPKCGFAHYSAFQVCGKKCYRYAKNQQPWIDKKIKNYKCQLLQEIYRKPSYEIFLPKDSQYYELLPNEIICEGDIFYGSYPPSGKPMIHKSFSIGHTPSENINGYRYFRKIQ